MSRRQSIETMGHDLHGHHCDQTGGEKAPNNAMDNLVTLCVLCHQKIHSITNKLLKRYARKTEKQETPADTHRGLGSRLSGAVGSGKLAGGD